MSRTALLFAGQGAQVVGMGRDFVEKSARAKEIFERANSLLSYDLTKICFDGPEEELTKTEHAQPGIFAVSWVVFELLMEAAPDFTFGATAGLSLGEFTALAAGGAMSFEDGLKLVRRRGLFMQEACDEAAGGMAAVLGLEELVVQEICHEAGVEIANLNCPGQIVVSGGKERIERACQLAKEKGAKRALPLPVAGAYHSRLMKSAQEKLKGELNGVEISAPSKVVVSNVTAAPRTDPDAIREGLLRQVVAPVRWEASIRYLLSQGYSRFIELGPGTALTNFMKRIDKNVEALNISDWASWEKTRDQLQLAR